MKRTVIEWVDYIQSLHAREIDLTLERVKEVYGRLCPRGVSFKVITIAGTNGKGSTAELLRSMYCNGGYKVGKYTSPHIISFNERINIDGVDVSDLALLEAFERVEAAREGTSLTYFEYATLAAIDLFDRAELDLAVMEVGLGGRQDATNMLDADVAVVTSISIDHTAWLGHSLEKIGREKIGIARQDRPCVLGMRQPPSSILEVCKELNIEPKILGKDFDFSLQVDDGPAKSHATWSWAGEDRAYHLLKLPFGQVRHQLNNASAAIQVVQLLNDDLPLSVINVATGIDVAKMSGRCQLVGSEPSIVLDVAHNEDSVVGLRAFIEGLSIRGRIVAVCGMLKDKQIKETLSHMVPMVDEWHFATIENERGSSSKALSQSVTKLISDQGSFNVEGAHPKQLICHSKVVNAYEAALATLTSDDCLVVFGSFFMVSDIIAHTGDDG
jgi:dihydrofolate synthase/folylpolyglutamate synthase